MWWSAKYLPVWAISTMTQYTVMALLISLGIFFDLAGIISFRAAKTTVNPLKPDSVSRLVTSGIYQYTRNPMYVGFVFFLCAWAVFLSSFWVIIFIGLYIGYIQNFQIIPEERALSRLFPQEFPIYKASVRAWL
jgi:protein-S-isoprenylcysteine O-methyltransferase Ste14